MGNCLGKYPKPKKKSKRIFTWKRRLPEIENIAKQESFEMEKRMKSQKEDPVNTEEFDVVVVNEVSNEKNNSEKIPCGTKKLREKDYLPSLLNFTMGRHEIYDGQDAVYKQFGLGEDTGKTDGQEGDECQLDESHVVYEDNKQTDARTSEEVAAETATEESAAPANEIGHANTTQTRIVVVIVLKKDVDKAALNVSCTPRKTEKTEQPDVKDIIELHLDINKNDKDAEDDQGLAEESMDKQLTVQQDAQVESSETLEQSAFDNSMGAPATNVSLDFHSILKKRKRKLLFRKKKGTKVVTFSEDVQVYDVPRSSEEYGIMIVEDDVLLNVELNRMSRTIQCHTKADESERNFTNVTT